MEAESAFIGADGAVELHAVTDVYLHITIVVEPRHAEHHDALGFNHAFNNFCFLEFGVFVVNILNGRKNFFHCLKKFGLSWMFLFQVLDNVFNFHNDVKVKR